MYPALLNIEKAVSTAIFLYMSGRQARQRRDRLDRQDRLSDVAHMKTARKASCRFGWRRVSKIDRRMRPAAPTIAARIAQTESAFCTFEVLCASLPLCLNQRSEIKVRSKTTTVTALPAMKSGFRP